MSTSSALAPSAPSPSVAALERVERNGWSFSMLLVRLGGDRLLIYSPTWSGADTFERVLAHGEPAAFVAPNHFHHLSLQRFRQWRPGVPAFASAGAIPRLVRKGHLALRDASELQPLLPEGTHLLAPEGLKNGEIWLSLPSEQGRTWVVGDAFFNVIRPVTGGMGLLLRWLEITPGLRFGRTFAWVGVADPRRYQRWLLEALERERPTGLWPCHGDGLSAPELPERLARLVRDRLRVADS